QFCLGRMRTFLEDQRATELQLRIELQTRTQRRVRDLLRITHREIDRAERLDERQAFPGPVGDKQPELRRLLELPGPAVVMRDNGGRARAAGCYLPPQGGGVHRARDSCG